jgi:membrane-associated phospholipid phosphatase
VAVLIVGGLAIAAIACLVGLLLSESSPNAELDVMRPIVDARQPALTTAAKALSMIGSLAVLGPLAALAAAWLIHRGQVPGAIRIATAGIGVVALTNLVKFAVERPRPPTTTSLVAVSSWSFPSQHAAQSAAILPSLVLALVPPGRRRRLALLGAGAIVVAVGISRVYLGVHYPSDVLAGWALGFAWLALAVRTMR